MKDAKDNFSSQSHLYEKFRPKYSFELVEHICSFAENKNLAWDCGTGNGQIANHLSRLFNTVVATDISKKQIEKAAKSNNIEYRIEKAEDSSLENNSVDVVLIAQAIHWFDFDQFYTEVKRVLKTNGVIAIIGYPLFKTENQDINKLIDIFYSETLSECWDSERRFIDERYQTIPFPFKEINIPNFKMTYQWSIRQLIGYIESWSAVANFKKKNQDNPLNLFEKDLKRFISEDDKITVNFDIIHRIGIYNNI